VRVVIEPATVRHAPALELGRVNRRLAGLLAPATIFDETATVRRRLGRLAGEIMGRFLHLRIVGIDRNFLGLCRIAPRHQCVHC